MYYTFKELFPTWISNSLDFQEETHNNSVWISCTVSIVLDVLPAPHVSI